MFGMPCLAVWTHNVLSCSACVTCYLYEAIYPVKQAKFNCLSLFIYTCITNQLFEGLSDYIRFCLKTIVSLAHFWFLHEYGQGYACLIGQNTEIKIASPG